LLTYRIAQRPERWKTIVSEAAALFALVVAASAVGLFLLGLAWSWATGGPARIACYAATAVACAMIQVQRFYAGVFRAFERFREESVSRIVQGAALAAGVIGLMLAGRLGLESALACLAVSHVRSGRPLSSPLGIPRAAP
jgi:O-antigen/teichoic acid export membrane protein